MGSNALTLHGWALSNGRIHPVVLGQPIGTLWSNIRARPSARSPPCRPDASVSPLQVPAAAPFVRGGPPRSRLPPLRTCQLSTPPLRGPLPTFRWHCYPPRPPVPPNPVAFDHGFYPFDFARTG